MHVRLPLTKLRFKFLKAVAENNGNAVKIIFGRRCWEAGSVKVTTQCGDYLEMMGYLKQSLDIIGRLNHARDGICYKITEAGRQVISEQKKTEKIS